MKFHATPLAGLTVVETDIVRDGRGGFVRVFCENEYSQLRQPWHWSQINLSQTKLRGTIRGMHFQHPPAAEAKSVRCVRGAVFDVAVDLRTGSSTFLQWHGVELHEDQPLQMFIPEGFAHGFQTLTDDVELLYLHSVSWDREREGRIRYDDPRVGIKWPLSLTHISEKDRVAPLLDDSFAGVRV